MYKPVWKLLTPRGHGSLIISIGKNDKAGGDRLGRAHDINWENTMTFHYPYHCTMEHRKQAVISAMSDTVTILYRGCMNYKWKLTFQQFHEESFKFWAIINLNEDKFIF